ncbi:hypothetical protein ACSBR1_005227 [Camellia fascicularis]
MQIFSLVPHKRYLHFYICHNADISKYPEQSLQRKGGLEKALKQTNPSPNEANILASMISQPSPTPIVPPLEDFAVKENHDSLSQPYFAKETKKEGTKAKQQQ